MLYSVLDDQILLGENYRNGSHSIKHEHLVVIFEDDGSTGYFYAMDLHQSNQPIVDKLFVYSINDIEPDSLKEPRKLQICWSEDGYKAFLMLNGYPHAAFDFQQFVGYNHSKYPEPEFGSMWTHKETNQELVNYWLTSL
ncbi:hypothetical protein EV697_10564 [Bisgaardia hudsonensis]|uniref:DUF2251 domain-containing protein n=1 Tax=Bisgaardia hudsonensis TaxID=109472 RepID=A0A4R2MTV3_9PAST|nr:DUF2251 domain-containing protein [Bisgaardia hudsonensis]QLB13620.1 hypothetical protein A6A11_08380 [Bisgaardia hudsonensis]TCP11952.1 hypothetical protein EV697_10564 [Bisgaardia hudsonensis]